MICTKCGATPRATQSHFVVQSHSQSHKVAVGVALGVAPQPLGVALGHSHYAKLEGGLESGGFQSVC